MAYKFSCIKCGEIIIVKFVKPGEMVKCRGCSTQMIVPTNAPEVDEESAATYLKSAPEHDTDNSKPKASSSADKNIDTSNTGVMDFKKLAQFAMAAGLVIFLFGGFKYLDAAAKAKQLSTPTGNYFETGFNQMAAAGQKQFAQKGASNLMVIGGIIIFIGFAVFASSGKPKESD